WDDANNQDGIRPDSIKVQLYANDKKAGDEVTLTAADNWTYTWSDLDEKSAGQTIVYTVKEVGKVDGYKVAIGDLDQGNVTITNTHTPAEISIKGSKTWKDAKNQDGIRPDEVVINLLADGVATGQTATVSKASDWSYEFKNLPKYKGGKEIVYSVTEDAVDGYTTTIDGYDVTNTHKPSTTKVVGKKTWDDADNKDKLRPESITVRLYANGKEVQHVVVTAKDKWSYSFENLPEYENGKKIEYS
ncbi:Cna B-type domain-containing protein, partial [Streptococcus zalophi]|uniref:Cna B-type domain-containing protein n=1 Tax=Streptococcus zalophi TaxID=640031 RepID=UPI00215C159E